MDPEWVLGYGCLQPHESLFPSQRVLVLPLSGELEEPKHAAQPRDSHYPGGSSVDQPASLRFFPLRIIPCIIRWECQRHAFTQRRKYPAVPSSSHPRTWELSTRMISRAKLREAASNLRWRDLAAPVSPAAPLAPQRKSSSLEQAMT